MLDINPLTNNQIFLKKIAENTGSDYETGDISEINPLTIDQIFLKEIAANTAGQSGDITELEGKVADNTGAIEAIVNVNGCCNILPNNATSTILNGITWTVNSDGTVTASGTAGSDGSNFAIFDYGGGSPFPAIGNKIYKSPAGASDSTYYILVLETPGNNWVKIYDEDYECNSNLRFINLSIAPNYAIQGSITFEPMLYDARLNPTGYVPYSMTNRELTEKVTWQKVTVTKSSATYDVGVWMYSSYTIPTGYTPISVYFTGDEELAGQFAIALSVPGIVRFCNASNSQKTTSLTYSVLCVKL